MSSPLSKRYHLIRNRSLQICAPLEQEDYVIQSMPDVSPPKWHLAHTTWFFERMVLQEYVKNYAPFNEKFYTLFNSYYQSLGARWRRDIRGTLSRPTVREVYEYRRAIDEKLLSFIEELSDDSKSAEIIQLGLQHEEQHQELLLTDIKHLLYSNPLRPAYSAPRELPKKKAPSPKYVDVSGGMVRAGMEKEGFAWDNEYPSHEMYLADFKLLSRLVTAGEFREFVQDDAYINPLLWLSEGWDALEKNGWSAPLYWENRDGEWWINTLSGERPLCDAEPVCHISYFEAEAFARWAGKRLPTEFEWEHAARQFASPRPGNFYEANLLHPSPTDEPTNEDRGVNQLFGDVWEWTRSAYLPYPGYRQAPPPLGEYNGKFMINQMVLRGGSCVTPEEHIRTSYRNFFHTDKRWQFTGFRLVEEV